jgi:phospholipid/cholesterol/gamma-HCH transport system substrate-binding protein
MSPKLVGAGAFVILGFVLFAGALFVIGERRMFFADRFTLYTEFASLGQLQPGAIVRVAGMNAGEVTEIRVPGSPAQKFRVRMEVRRDVRPLIRTDSVASTDTEGLVGSIFVNIAIGSEAAAPIQEGGTIAGREPFALADLVRQASDTVMLINHSVESLSGELEKSIAEVTATTREARMLLSDIGPDIKAVAENSNRLSTDVQQMVTGLRAGEGTLGKLLTDDALYVRAREISEEARAVMANVRDVSEEARRAIAEFQSKDGPAQGLMNDVRVTLDEARNAAEGLADNMDALKRNFLFRGFFNRRGYYDLDAISPSQYREGVLENGQRRALRIWLAASVLFETRPDGTEVLAESGRARVDSAMATYLRYIPANPLVVEGFAAEGTAGERYRRSRDRALAVRSYLVAEYGLSARHTGAIALGADAPGSPAGDEWDGVAIALFLDIEALEFADPGD